MEAPEKWAGRVSGISGCWEELGVQTRSWKGGVRGTHNWITTNGFFCNVCFQAMQKCRPVSYSFIILRTFVISCCTISFFCCHQFQLAYHKKTAGQLTYSPQYTGWSKKAEPRLSGFCDFTPRPHRGSAPGLRWWRDPLCPSWLQSLATPSVVNALHFIVLLVFFVYVILSWL